MSARRLLALVPALLMMLHPVCARADQSDVMGFGILKRLPGLWNGPVVSSTPAGSFAKWYVDFRPVSPGQVSQYSTLDENTLNYLFFFIVNHDGRLKVALRTEGVFMNKGCVTYEVIDKADEAGGYYRFSDFQIGDKRAFTEFRFQEDDLVMDVYTNKFNTVFPLTQHARWKAHRYDARAAEQAVAHFSFPQRTMVKDFTHTFDGRFDCVYVDLDADPYNSKAQPYVGEITVNIDMAGRLKVRSTDELFLLLTTRPLFDGITYNPENLNYTSRFVYLPESTEQYTFRNIHPGTYYLYSFLDINNDGHHSSGDYMSSNLAHTVTVPPEGHVATDTTIDSILP
jgi:hypothetical protein